MQSNRPLFIHLAPVVLCAGVSVAVMASAVRSADADKLPELTANQVQELVRYSHSLEDIDLNGMLSSSSPKLRIPFVLSIGKNSFQFNFASPNQAIVLEQLPSGYKLIERIEDETTAVPGEKYGKKVRGTDVLYEDLAMRFLYWPQANVVAEEMVKNRAAWKLHIVNPKRTGPYSQVFIWVDKGSGGLMKMQAFDWDGKFVKQYEIVSGQKIGDAWIPKKMNVITYDPASSPKRPKEVGRTALELRGRK